MKKVYKYSVFLLMGLTFPLWNCFGKVVSNQSVYHINSITGDDHADAIIINNQENHKQSIS